VTHRPFRFGAGLFIASSRAAFCDRARQIEAMGFATILIPDHFGNQLAPGPFQTAAALATSTLRVGATVYANDYRHPAVLAKELASIDVLSDGRLEAGIGAGWTRREYEALGMPFDPAGTRVSRMQEGLAVMRGLWADGPFSFDGCHYTVTKAEGWPKPVQRPHPPLYIGAGGPRMLRYAAREADIVGILAQALPSGHLDTGGDTEALVARKVEIVREAAGDRFAAIELNMLIWDVRVTGDPRAVAEELASTRQVPTTPEQILGSPYYLIGTEAQIEDRLHELRERFGVSYVSFFPKDVDSVAPIVARLAGA
jgi:probable F420-dependent oxidoreductase